MKVEFPRFSSVSDPATLQNTQHGSIRAGKGGQDRFAGTARRVLRTKRSCPPFSAAGHVLGGYVGGYAIATEVLGALSADEAALAVSHRSGGRETHHGRRVANS